VTNKDRQPLQQPIIASLPTTIKVTTNLLTHIPKGSNHQPLDGGQPIDSPRGSSLRGLYQESHPSIHLSDLLDGQHLIHVCLYHCGINQLLCNLFQNQPPSCHIVSYNTQPMSKTLIHMLTSKYSRWPLKLMVK
jgi:hypothetical protein